MKKTILAAASLFFLLVVTQDIWARSVTFGVGGGITSSSAKLNETFNAKSITGWQVGAMVKVPVGLGFAVQPGVFYQVKGVQFQGENPKFSVSELLKTKTEQTYVEIPVQVQWGPDLVFLRPYIFAEPFLGFGISSKTTIGEGASAQSVTENFKEAGLNAMEYGLGLGGGLEVWKLQLSVKYFWNFGKVYPEGSDTKIDFAKIGDTVKNAFKDKQSFNGVAVNLVLFF